MTGRKRLDSIDIIKSIAILCVLLIHISAPGVTNYPIESIRWKFLVAIGTSIRVCVPLFFMSTGALVFGRDIDGPKLFKKYILRYLIILFSWALIYKLLNLFLYESLSPELILESLKQVILFNHHTHFYYIHILLLVYLCLPIINVYLRAAKKKDIEYLLVVWFLFGIVYPSIRGIWPFNLINGIPLQYGINMTYASMGYGILGYYIKNYIKEIDGKFGLIFIASTLLNIGITIFVSIMKTEPYLNLWEGMSPLVALASASLFAYVLKHTDENKEYKFFRKFSALSFIIYLAHDLFNVILQYHGYSILSVNPYIYIILGPAVILVSSLILYYLIVRLPLLKRYLI